jgi:hypothetical protein
MICYRCGTEIEVDNKPFRRDECPKCQSYLHCCKNCQFYDPTAFQECREPGVTKVKDKEMANMCGFMRPITEKKSQSNAAREEDAREKLRKLFNQS